jgi:two-component system phosphate regulon response regulator PhoB
MKAHILIVDNEPDIADIVRRYLEFEGFATACAASCEAARALCAERLPDLIVLDWRLPDTDGDVWIAELRANQATASIPVVLMTGGYPTRQLIAQMDAAHIPILIKPFSLDLLLTHIEDLLPRQCAFGLG